MPGNQPPVLRYKCRAPRGRVRAAGTGGGVDAGSTRFADRADAFRGVGHAISRPQRGRFAAAGPAPELRQATAAEGTGAEHVAGADPGPARGVRDLFLQQPGHAGQRVGGQDLAVAVGEAEREPALRPPDVAGGPVAEQGLAGDVVPGLIGRDITARFANDRG